ncbi:MAG: 4Fe-4S dicluster domain-containing protein, partial [Candidatus Hydrogenedentes bacterium]|nr:4Fe-4S dicluster domain-containing protein [Candidatus Hydrogenedentota bacterium]
ELAPKVRGHRERKNVGFIGAFLSRIRELVVPSVREYRAAKGKARKNEEQGTGVNVQQLADILDPSKYETAPLTVGGFFGEIGAIYRMPREISILAAEPARILEIRWQGLRDLMEADEGIERHIDGMYRERSLKGTLESISLFKALPEKVFSQIKFNTYGKYDEWSSEYIGLSQDEKTKVIDQEEMIAQEGDYPNGIHIVRAGFARESKRYGHGHQTLNYLGGAQIFGLKEALYNWQHPNNPIPFQHSLRAIGYAHILTIPTHLVEKHVLPTLLKEQPDFPRYRSKDIKAGKTDTANTLRDDIGADLFEFFSEHRLLNGTKTMLINLDRCTRCDDCVRGCASAHDNNPRFVRHGPIHGNIMVANACMHCQDPVCMIECPTGAISRRLDEGEVAINDDTCIGCSSCSKNCPYDAIRMVEIRDKQGWFVRDQTARTQLPITKATKCDLCVDQLGGPACQRACPHDALVRMDMSNIVSLTTWHQK